MNKKIYIYSKYSKKERKIIYLFFKVKGIFDSFTRELECLKRARKLFLNYNLKIKLYLKIYILVHAHRSQTCANNIRSYTA